MKTVRMLNGGTLPDGINDEAGRSVGRVTDDIAKMLTDLKFAQYVSKYEYKRLKTQKGGK